MSGIWVKNPTFFFYFLCSSGETSGKTSFLALIVVPLHALSPAWMHVWTGMSSRALWGLLKGFLGKCRTQGKMRLRREERKRTDWTAHVVYFPATAVRGNMQLFFYISLHFATFHCWLNIKVWPLQRKQPPCIYLTLILQLGPARIGILSDPDTVISTESHLSRALVLNTPYGWAELAKKSVFCNLQSTLSCTVYVPQRLTLPRHVV